MARLRLMLALLAVSLWFVSGCACPQAAADEEPAEQEALTAADDEADEADAEEARVEDERPDEVESDTLPLADSPVMGAASAPVTIVEFSNFQCRFCARAAETMEKLVDKYPDEVRVVFKHNPLPMHQQAKDAHRAAQAAHNQGKFFEMKAWLFENQKAFRENDGNFEDWTAGYAEQLGLDVEQFRRDFNADETTALIERDLDLSRSVGVRGTPHFFVNGKRVKGAKPLSDFERVVDRQLRVADQRLARGDIDRDELYAAVVERNFDGPSAEEAARAAARRAKRLETLVEYVDVRDDDPMRGATDDYLVTLVEFSSFQCPFCNKVRPTVDQIEEEYGDKVRIVFKQLPLGMQPQSKPAAKAALAAHRQGKFWQMHELLFDNQREMRSKDDFKEWAAELAAQLELDVDQFKADYDDPELAKRVEEDAKLASRIGARGTPNFWINGVNKRGAQPFAVFKQELDKQIEIAEKLEADKGLTGDELYKAAVAVNDEDSGSKEPPSRPQKPDPKVDLDKLDAGDAYTMGPDDAPVTIVEFSDFQCPYCARGSKHLRSAAAEFDGQVRIVFKHYPLPFHKQAEDAGKAAMAAGEQGKFWEMYELLFENQKRLKEDEIFVELADELDLDLKQFENDFSRSDFAQLIEADMKQGQAVGVRGTPAYFINGTRIVGAQPKAKFEEAIKEALDASNQDE